MNKLDFRKSEPAKKREKIKCGRSIFKKTAIQSVWMEVWTLTEKKILGCAKINEQIVGPKLSVFKLYKYHETKKTGTKQEKIKVKGSCLKK